jgi:hypothetical protein
MYEHIKRRIRRFLLVAFVGSVLALMVLLYASHAQQMPICMLIRYNAILWTLDLFFVLYYVPVLPMTGILYLTYCETGGDGGWRDGRGRRRRRPKPPTPRRGLSSRGRPLALRHLGLRRIPMRPRRQTAVVCSYPLLE